MFIATVDTPHFRFLALGDTEVEARQALMKGWYAHCKEYKRAERSYVQPDEICIGELEVGDCLRDFDKIPGMHPTKVQTHITPS